LGKESISLVLNPLLPTIAHFLQNSRVSSDALVFVVLACQDFAE